MTDILLGVGLNFSNLPQQVVNGILYGAIYALIALGYTMVYGVLRLINFAHSEVFMLGMYAALLTAWQLGFTPNAAGAEKEGSLMVLVLMILVAMQVCGLVGVLIEFLAYRPMRNQSRVAALITAIGVSLFLQYAGQLFLPNSPPPNVPQNVNPYQGSFTFTLRSPSEDAQRAVVEARTRSESAEARFDQQLKVERSRFDLSETGKTLRDEMNTAQQEMRALEAKVLAETTEVRVPRGQLVMLVTVLVLMTGLYFLVNHTKVGRGMRAASHDFDSASLMGVSVNRVVVFTFLIGSVLAGAGAMMYATFLGSSITPFAGVQPGVKAFVAAVLGGIGNIPGAVLGGLLMGLAEALVQWAGYSKYSDAVAFVILILVLLLKPGGLLGSNKVEKV